MTGTDSTVLTARQPNNGRFSAKSAASAAAWKTYVPAWMIYAAAWKTYAGTWKTYAAAWKTHATAWKTYAGTWKTYAAAWKTHASIPAPAKSTWGYHGRAGAATVGRSVCAASIALSTTAAFGQWSFTSLHPPIVGGSWTTCASGSAQAGVYRFGTGISLAALWNGTSASFVSLHPAFAESSQIMAMAGGKQGGSISTSTSYRAALWSGTAASVIDLHPGGIWTGSQIFGMDAQQQVGSVGGPSIGPYAAMWESSAASLRVLHPPSPSNVRVYFSSIAYAVDAGQQVGAVRVGVVGGDFTIAGLWTGTAESFVELHPANATSSGARAVSRGRQGGGATVDGVERASLWSGTAASWVDLHPVGAVSSGVIAMGAGHQVGAMQVSNGSRPVIWQGTRESAVDLSAFVPPTYAFSEVSSVSTDGLRLIVAGTATNLTTGFTEAVIWTKPCTPPQIAVHPVAVRGCETGTFAMTVVPSGPGPFLYQWRKAGVPIDAATNPTAASSTLVLTDVTPADAGVYRCVVTTAIGCGSTTSNGALFSVVGVCCDTIDFNGNDIFPEDADIEDYFTVMAGGDCPTGTCNDIDFNNNGVFPEDQDIVDFFNVLAGGTCP